LKTADVIAQYPVVFHMADPGAWVSMFEHGLLSTTALLDRMGIEGARRAAIEAEIRPESVRIDDPELGRVCIRDNTPLRRHILESCLDVSVEDWCRALNARVFFWATPQRVETHLGAGGHRGRPRDVIAVDTARLVARHGRSISLCHINSGSALYPNAPARGRSTFSPIADFQFEHWRAKRSAATAIAEVCVDYAVPDIRDLALWVERRDPQDGAQVLWRAGPRRATRRGASEASTSAVPAPQAPLGY
jgi:uncharacterized protein DUF7002